MNTLTRASVALLVVLSLPGLVSSVCASTTYYVDDDGVADFHTIQEAVDAAATGDTILLQPGLYTGSGNWDVVVTGKAVTVRSADPNDAATVAATVIDCRGTSTVGHRAFIVTENSGVHLTLAGLTMINGLTTYNGGAVWCQDAGLTVINCTFSDNEAGWWGGAVCCVNCSATFRGCTFTNGNSKELTGGAVYCGSTVVSFTDCMFDSNVGNAVVGRESGVTLTDCTFQDNVGEDGGGLHIYAGLSNEDAYLNMTGCVFVGNISNASGGAFHGINAQGTIDACTFMDNTTAADGGAIYTRHSSPMISNCLFVANLAAGIGGAVANSFESKPQIINCTLVANEATSGGAMATSHDADPLISHSILWDNVAATGTGLYLQRIDTGGGYSAQTTIQYCDIQNGPLAAYADSGCTLTWGEGNIDADPLFTGPLFDDYHLSADSPCIDAGNPKTLPAPGATDLDGYPRLYGDAVDMGTHEYHGLGPVYRFWSPVQGKHFYTISGAERDHVLKEYVDIYDYEGVGFYAYYNPTEEGLAPVHRFWSSTLQAHFWTINEQEKDALLKGEAGSWEYEGVVFYAYPSSQHPLGASPVYRFWSDGLGQHFYTIDEIEKAFVLKAYPRVWTYESIAWYAFTEPYESKQTAYTFTGGADDIWYTLSLEAYVDGQEALIDQPQVSLIPAVAEMEMAIDFTNMAVMFKTLQVETQMAQHTATITTAEKADPLTIPVTLSVGGSFAALTQQGPFAIDAASGIFADYTQAGASLTAEQATYTYSGSLTLNEARADFTRVSNASQFELQSYGIFEGLDTSADGLTARMPTTFQWHRPDVKDLLMETMVDGHLVQIYITYVYVGTQGIWEGQAVN